MSDFEMYRSAKDSATKDEYQQTFSKYLLSTIDSNHSAASIQYSEFLQGYSIPYK